VAASNSATEGAAVPPKFILQGLTPQNHVSAVADLVQVDGVKVVLLSVAFVSSTGVQLIADHLEPHADKTTVFAGIRNGITSAQAIRALLDIGVAVKTVDTGSAHVVFHPKLYYARGAKVARLLVGSANLTTGGLNNNVEASVALELNLSSPEDRQVAEAIEKELGGLQAKHPDNVAGVSAKTTLAKLLADPRLVDERVAPARTVSKLSGGSGALNPIPLIKLLTKRIVAGLTKKPSAPKVPPAAAPAVPPAGSYELMWTTTGLTQRDLNIPKGTTTNATGSINLDKGAMEDGFEFQTFFREEVFDKLTWGAPDARQIEAAQAQFRLVVEGIDCGEFVLVVRHDTKTGTKSHDQGNAMTKLSWGAAKPYVAKDALIGRTLRLSRATDDPTRFLIEID
jgi:HKD family nuclease